MIMRLSFQKDAPKKFRRKFACFKRDQNGVTAVEFALVAFPFFVFVFATLELAISFVAQQVLSSAVDDLSRRFYTGQLTIENTTPTVVRKALCDRIQFMVAENCPNLQINLDNYLSFSAIPVKNLVTKEGRLGLPETINIGGLSTINQLNVLYRWPAITNILVLTEGNKGLRGNFLPLFVTTTWQNEPYT